MKCLNCNCDTDRMDNANGYPEPECLECWKQEQPGSRKCQDCGTWCMPDEYTDILGHVVCTACERKMIREWKVWEYEQLLADEELYFCDDYND